MCWRWLDSLWMVGSVWCGNDGWDVGGDSSSIPASLVFAQSLKASLDSLYRCRPIVFDSSSVSGVLIWHLKTGPTRQWPPRCWKKLSCFGKRSSDLSGQMHHHWKDSDEKNFTLNLGSFTCSCCWGSWSGSRCRFCRSGPSQSPCPGLPGQSGWRSGPWAVGAACHCHHWPRLSSGAHFRKPQRMFCWDHWQTESFWRIRSFQSKQKKRPTS